MTESPTSPATSPPPAAGVEDAARGGKPETLIAARRGWQAVNLSELWRYRELLFFLVWRDLKVRYKQTILGAAWAVLQPVTMMLIFWAVFGVMGGMAAKSAVPYPVLVFPALLPWMFFASGIGQGGNSLVNSAHLISKVYFPRLLIPMSALGAPLVDFCLSLLVLAVIIAGYLISGHPDVRITPQVFLLPVFLGGTAVAALGVGTLFSALTIAYRDFRHLLGFLSQVWLFVTPVAYPIEMVPERWQTLYALNPMVGMVVGFQRCITGEPIPWGLAAISLAVAVLILVVGVLYFRRIERRFADIV